MQVDEKWKACWIIRMQGELMQCRVTRNVSVEKQKKEKSKWKKGEKGKLKNAWEYVHCQQFIHIAASFHFPLFLLLLLG